MWDLSRKNMVVVVGDVVDKSVLWVYRKFFFRNICFCFCVFVCVCECKEGGVEVCVCFCNLGRIIKKFNF